MKLHISYPWRPHLPDLVVFGEFQHDPPGNEPPIADAAGYVKLAAPVIVNGVSAPAGAYMVVPADACVETESGSILHAPRRRLLPGLWVIEANGGTT